MSRYAVILSAIILALALPAGAETLRIAVVAPATGNLAILGEQVRRGAAIAADGKAELVNLDESCSDEADTGMAARIVESGAVAAIGFLCSRSLEDVLPALAAKNIAAITLSVRASILMEDALKKGWPLFRLAPSPTAEREKIVEAIATYWQGMPFAILDDGTITSRETADNVRSALEQKGIKATFLDNFRPAQEVQSQLIRRLVKAGVTHVFAAADRGDMSVIARDAEAAGQQMVFLGGDALNAPDQQPPLETGVLAVTVPDYTTLPLAAAVVRTLEDRGENADGYVLPAHAAVSILLGANEIAAGSGASITEALVDTPFDTVIGEIRFLANHERSTNPFELLEWNGSALVPPVTTQ